MSLLIVFLAGIWLIFEWRFRSGDIYPPGSSLRSDPRGAGVFYETLEEIPGIAVARNFEHYRKLEGAPGRMLLFVGASFWFVDGYQRRPEISALEKFALEGGRIVVTLNPQAAVRARVDEEVEEVKEEMRDALREKSAREEGEGEGEGEKERGDGQDDDDEGDASMEALFKQLYTSLNASWGLKLERQQEDAPEGGWRVRGTEALEGVTKRELPRWKSSQFFVDPGPEWEVLARVEGKPVLLRKEAGKGEILVSSDSRFLSNESLVLERCPRFLAWLVEGSREVIFDETHHGTRYRPGLMQMVGKYRLHGFFLGLGIFVALLTWRSATSLLPGAQQGREESTAGRHGILGDAAASGLRKLLRRSLGAHEFLGAGFSAWREHAALLPRPVSEAQLAAVEKIVRQESEKGKATADPVDAYRRIAKILSKRV